MENEQNQHMRLIDLFLNLPAEKRFILGINQHSRGLAKTIKVAGFIDEFSELKIIDGIRVFNNFSQIDSNTVIINASTMRPHSSSKRLNAMGIRNIHIFNFIEHLVNIPEKIKYQSTFREDYSKNRNVYEQIRKALSDDQSKSVFDIFTESRLTGNINNNFTLLNFNTEHQYFENFLELGDSGETFIDCGAYDGSDSINFFNFTSFDNFSYLVEPNLKNYNLINNNLMGLLNYHLFEFAASNTDGFEYFNLDLQTASRRDNRSNLAVPTKRLDSIDFTRKPTFIKMDIEGMELAALYGGERLIREAKPKLAISVYHKFDDLRNIFLFMSDVYGSFNLFMRHYTEGTDETILYALPK